MMEDKFFDLFNESLKVVSSYCPVCNSKYNPVEAKILEERNDSHLIHIKCRNCSASIVALVIVGNMGVSSIGMVTDLQSDEVLKFKSSRPVTADEVLDFHQTISQFEKLI
ncbi:MAG: hypothetical protein JW816_01670 [Candidatus Buchananbacteria bacterium]|nr:hypothetical protein [Candidatus Buchananbacteria bacterium]